MRLPPVRRVRLVPVRRARPVPAAAGAAAAVAGTGAGCLAVTAGTVAEGAGVAEARALERAVACGEVGDVPTRFELRTGADPPRP